MKQLFLTSSINFVASDIAEKIENFEPNFPILNIITAAEVETGDKAWMDEDKKAMLQAGFQVEDYTVSGKTEAQIIDDLHRVKGVHVGGGNTFYLLQQIIESGFDKALHHIWWERKNFVYMSTSAGSQVAGPDISPDTALDDREHAPRLMTTQGLGLVDFFVVPHWGSSIFQDRYLDSFVPVTYHQPHPLVLINDHQYAWVSDGWLKIIEVRDSS